MFSSAIFDLAPLRFRERNDDLIVCEIGIRRLKKQHVQMDRHSVAEASVEDCRPVGRMWRRRLLWCLLSFKEGYCRKILDHEVVESRSCREPIRSERAHINESIDEEEEVLAKTEESGAANRGAGREI